MNQNASVVGYWYPKTSTKTLACVDEMARSKKSRRPPNQDWVLANFWPK